MLRQHARSKCETGGLYPFLPSGSSAPRSSGLLPFAARAGPPGRGVRRSHRARDGIGSASRHPDSRHRVHAEAAHRSRVRAAPVVATRSRSPRASRHRAPPRSAGPEAAAGESPRIYFAVIWSQHRRARLSPGGCG